MYASSAKPVVEDQSSAVQDDDCFAWIDTLVCDFVEWYLNHFENGRVAFPRPLARQFGKAWKMRFMAPRTIDGGIEHVSALVASGLPVDLLQSINALIAQELRLFFLSRSQEPMPMRLSQARFVDLQGAIMERNLAFYDEQWAKRA